MTIGLKATRRLVQLAFLAITVVGVFVVRGNAERWCPFGGVEALYGYLHEGNMLCSLGVSNFYILAAVLGVTILLRRAFCGYACPIGAISEWLGSLAAWAGLRPRGVLGRLDRGLALLKYAVLAVVLWFTYRSGELMFRGFDPCYALLSRHGEDITFWAYVVAGGLVLGSVFVTMPFCRWLCPLAAVLQPFSRFGVARIKRNAQVCIGCKSCSQACPMAIPVHEVHEVTAARCLSCLNCVEACPVSEARAISWGPPRPSGAAWPQAVLIGTLLLCVTTAVAAVYTFPMASFVRVRGAEPARTATVELRVSELSCRGRATLFAYYLERDDEFEVPGYLRIEAWPGPGLATVRISFDPDRTDEATIRSALTEAYFDVGANVWRTPPFTIEGYDPLGLGADEAAASPGESR